MTHAKASAAGEIEIGIDAEHADRFALGPGGLLPAGLAVSFSGEEHKVALGSPQPPHTYATMWCAKEAVVKAVWVWIRLDPRRVTISGVDRCNPLVSIDQEAPGALGLGICVSIMSSSDPEVAVAVAWRMDRALSHGTHPISHTNIR